MRKRLNCKYQAVRSLNYIFNVSKNILLTSVTNVQRVCYRFQLISLRIQCANSSVSVKQGILLEIICRKFAHHCNDTVTVVLKQINIRSSKRNTQLCQNDKSTGIETQRQLFMFVLVSSLLIYRSQCAGRRRSCELLRSVERSIAIDPLP